MAAQAPFASNESPHTAMTQVLDLIKVKLLAMSKEDLVDMVLDLSRTVVQLEVQVDNDKVARNDLEKQLDVLKQHLSEASEKNSSAGDPTNQLASTSPSIVATTMTNTASNSPVQQFGGSALDALTASINNAQCSEQHSLHNSDRQVVAHEIFEKYHIDSDAQSKFYESRKLRNFATRQHALELFLKRVGETQGRNVLSVILGKGATTVNHSRLFVQCVREVETRVVR